jgi:hypothetical protein
MYHGENLRDPNVFPNTMLFMAKEYGINLFLLKEKDFDAESETLSGIFLENGTRMRRRVDLPHLLDNSGEGCYIGNGVFADTVKRRCVLVQPFRKLSKLGFHKALLKIQNPEYKDVVILSRKVRQTDDVFACLRMFDGKICLKPSRGSWGRGVMKIAEHGDGYEITEKKIVKEISREEMAGFLTPLLTGAPYVAQPFINSRTKHGHPYDIRVLARRGKGGAFVIFLIPRIGDAGGIISNLHSGGYSMPIDPFLKMEFEDRWQEIKKRLTAFGAEFAECFQSEFTAQSAAFGFDIGIQKTEDNDVSFHLFEVNCHPGNTNNLYNAQASIVHFEYYRHLYDKFYDKAEC